MTLPATHANIISSFKEHIQSIRHSANAKLVVIIDSISSNPGCLLPWKELVHACREAGIISIVDAAHSIGQELHINLSQAQPDFWVSVRRCDSRINALYLTLPCGRTVINGFIPSVAAQSCTCLVGNALEFLSGFSF